MVAHPFFPLALHSKEEISFAHPIFPSDAWNGRMKKGFFFAFEKEKQGIKV